jgi:hypothetical protein
MTYQQRVDALLRAYPFTGYARSSRTEPTNLQLIDDPVLRVKAAELWLSMHPNWQPPEPREIEERYP